MACGLLSHQAGRSPAGVHVPSHLTIWQHAGLLALGGGTGKREVLACLGQGLLSWCGPKEAAWALWRQGNSLLSLRTASAGRRSAFTGSFCCSHSYLSSMHFSVACDSPSGSRVLSACFSSGQFHRRKTGLGVGSCQACALALQLAGPPSLGQA